MATKLNSAQPPRLLFLRERLKLRLLPVYAAAILVVAISSPRIGSAPFLAGIILIACGEVLRIWAAGHLEKNKKLTTGGPYAHMKNPLYVGTVLITSGLFMVAHNARTADPLLANANWVLLAVAWLVLVMYYLPLKKSLEYERMETMYGTRWTEYERTVPDYFPRLRPYRSPEPQVWQFRRILQNSEHWTCLAVLAIMAAILLKA